MKRVLKSLCALVLATAMVTASVPLSVRAASNQETIFAFLMEEIGFNSAAACGVLANIEKESSFNPNAYGDGGASYGICQWNTFRFTALQTWCGANGHDYTTLEGQLRYLQFELSANNANYLWNGKTIYNKLAAVTDTAEGAYAAAYDWCYYFEVPANREKKARDRGNLAVSAYWPVYGQGDPAPTVAETLTCDYGVTVAAEAGEIPLYDSPTVDAESGRWLENRAEPLTLQCSQKLTLSNGAVRYYYYDEEQGRGYYLPFNPYLMTVQQTHTWGDWETQTESTCTATGLLVRACACGAKETQTVKKAAHAYAAYTKKATQTANGYTAQRCAVCKKETGKATLYKANKVTLAKTDYTYNGKVQKPAVVVKDAKGKTIPASNYTVKYASGCKNAGTYKVTVTFKGNYSGQKVLTYKIKPLDVSKCKVSLSGASLTYNGAVRKPAVTVKNQNGVTLTNGASYTVTYASGRKNVGTYKVTVKMKGNYTGSKTLTFTINPPKTAVSKLTAGKKSLKVTVAKKSAQVTGYQVQYATSKSFKTYKTKTLSSYKTVSTTLPGLTAKKTYYVRVRTYKMVNGKKYYSGWSAVKAMKTK